MDLIDLYHAHELAEYTDFEPERIEEVAVVVAKQHEVRDDSRLKKARFVPWEPHKAATGPDSTIDSSSAPTELPKLIPYGMRPLSEVNNNDNASMPLLVDSRKLRMQQQQINAEPSEEMKQLRMEVQRLKDELSIEHDVNAEMKRLMVATISGELQSQLQALSEDKIRLAHKLQQYTDKLVEDGQELDMAKTERDMWRCKFLAQSIRCDEINTQCARLLAMLKHSQNVLKKVVSDETSSEVREVAVRLSEVDLQPFFGRSPCESRVRPRDPNFVNLTVSCCTRCAGREIYLL